jgi:two-component system, OmpR family, sensor kinase
MSRIPIRLRVAAAFAVAMAIVLAATGLYLYARLGNDLAHALDQDLRLRAQDLSAVVRSDPSSLSAESSGRLVERGESFAQVLDANGRELDSTPTLDHVPLLTVGETRAARHRPLFVNRAAVPGLDEPARLLATPVTGGARLVLVVGATRENRAEALQSLRTELFIAGPIALVIATGLGYLLAGSGLRAVEAMRRRAAAISADRRGERLPVPRSGDELERLGTTLNEMLARLEGALERERAFVTEAGHELRTPLALLRAELDFALQHAEGEHELRDAVRGASEETDRLVQLAADLLLIASSGEGGLPLRRDPLAARGLLESVRNRFAWRAEQAGRPLEAEAPPALVLIADALRLEQALGNLVENALRHGQGAIRLEARPSGNGVELHVLDQGPGFPPDFLPRAFERFSRAEESRTSAGAGLGLAIVDVVARAHGGTAAAANGTDTGADVWIALPAAVVQQRAASGQRDPSVQEVL